MWVAAAAAAASAVTTTAAVVVAVAAAAAASPLIRGCVSGYTRTLRRPAVCGCRCRRAQLGNNEPPVAARVRALPTVVGISTAWYREKVGERLPCRPQYFFPVSAGSLSASASFVALCAYASVGGLWRPARWPPSPRPLLRPPPWKIRQGSEDRFAG